MRSYGDNTRPSFHQGNCEPCNVEFANGADDPETFAPPFPTLQVAFPLQGTNRRLCGAIAAHGVYGLFPLHSGKVSGKRMGLGKSEFVRYGSDFEMANELWPDGLVTPHFVLGRVGTDGLPASIARYMQGVLAFKRSAR